MNSLTPSVQVFIWRTLFSASIGYLAIALFLLQPTTWFGLAHCAWATFSVIGSWRAFKAYRQLEAEARVPKN